MSNPIVNAAVTVSGILASVGGTKLLTQGWQAAFGEEPPTPKAQSKSAKETKKKRKQAKKDGLSKAEIAQIRDPQKDVATWKTVLWLVLSAVFITGAKELAKRGVKSGGDRLTERRPRHNRG